jgi:hypothetical protein
MCGILDFSITGKCIPSGVSQTEPVLIFYGATNLVPPQFCNDGPVRIMAVLIIHSGADKTLKCIKV